MIGGVVATSSDKLAKRLAYLQNSIGSVSGPFDSFLALRGVKTLDVRMERHCRTSLQIAKWLEGQVPHVLVPIMDLRNPAAHKDPVPFERIDRLRRNLLGIGCEGLLVQIGRAKMRAGK